MIPAYATSDAGRVGLRHNGAFELRWMNWIFNLFEPEGDRDGARNKEVMAKLGEQVRDVRLDRAFADAEPLCNFGVREAFGDEPEDLALSRCE